MNFLQYIEINDCRSYINSRQVSQKLSCYYAETLLGLVADEGLTGLTLAAAAAAAENIIHASAFISYESFFR